MNNSHSKHEKFKYSFKLLTLITGFALVVLIVVLAFLILPVISDPTDDFFNRKGTLVNINKTRHWTDNNSNYTELTLTSSSGLQVKLTTRVPQNMTTPGPVVILLGGQDTGRDATQLVTDTHNVVLVALSYSLRIEQDMYARELLFKLPKIRLAIIDAPPSVSLVIDYLLSQPYVNPDHIELAGISLGAFLVGVPGSLDSRIKRVWIIHGSGEPDKVFEHGLRSHIDNAFFRKNFAKFLETVIAGHHLKPEKWVNRIAPRPVVLINNRDDEILPLSSIEMLHNAAGKSAEFIWLEGHHVKPHRADIIEALSTLVLSRIKREADDNLINSEH